MTEDEAKTKWCPMSRPAVGAGVIVTGGNRAVVMGTDTQGCNVKSVEDGCIGSACMMWRERAILPGTESNPPVMGGYCGLAGKP